jgi:hypothetical protein
MALMAEAVRRRHDQRRNHMQKIMPTKLNKSVQKDIEPMKAKANLTGKGRNVAKTTMANTTKIAPLMMITGEYFLRAEQVEVNTTSGVFPQRDLRTAVTTNTSTMKKSAKGIISLTNGINPKNQTSAFIVPSMTPRMSSTQLGRQNRLLIITPP